MTKEEWKELYKILNEIYSEFNKNYRDYQNGKNKKAREEALKRSKSAILLADFHIKKNREALVLLIDGRDFFYNEFRKIGYFENDMIDFLK